MTYCLNSQKMKRVSIQLKKRKDNMENVTGAHGISWVRMMTKSTNYSVHNTSEDIIIYVQVTTKNYINEKNFINLVVQ